MYRRLTSGSARGTCTPSSRAEGGTTVLNAHHTAGALVGSRGRGVARAVLHPHGSRARGANGGSRPSSHRGAAIGRDAALHDRHAPVSYTHLRAHETDSYLVC